MSITATELKQNLKEDIYITKQGKVIAKLTNPYQNRVDTAKSLFGILQENVNELEEKAERLSVK